MEAQVKEWNQRIVYVAAAALAVVVVGSAYLGYSHRLQASERLARNTMTWFDSPREMSKVFLDRYGPPSVLSEPVVTWYGQEPWKRISIHGYSPDNYLEQAVGYQAGPAAVAPIREFGHGVGIDLAREELTVRSNSEALNFLALNLAHDVASGKRTPMDARRFYLLETKLAAAGKSSPYLEKLLFEPYRFLPQERMPNLIGY